MDFTLSKSLNFDLVSYVGEIMTGNQMTNVFFSLSRTYTCLSFTSRLILISRNYYFTNDPLLYFVEMKQMWKKKLLNVTR